MDHKDIRKILKITGNCFLVFGILLLPVSFISYHSIEFVRYLLNIEEYLKIGPLHIYNPLNVVYLLPVIYSLLGLILGLSGIGLILEKSWAKKLAYIPSVIMLLFFPVGTIIGGFLLYVLLKERDIQHV